MCTYATKRRFSIKLHDKDSGEHRKRMIFRKVRIIYVAILKPQGLRQSGSSLHLERGQISTGFELQVKES